LQGVRANRYERERVTGEGSTKGVDGSKMGKRDAEGRGGTGFTQNQNGEGSQTETLQRSHHGKKGGGDESKMGMEIGVERARHAKRTDNMQENRNEES